jgi:predicted metal-dependent phosphoesterase TrpH
MIESLHNHTRTSDGKLSHEELFALAGQLGVGVLAFTDHDALPDAAAVQFLESVRDRSTKWIIGIEITAGLPVECHGIQGTVHIIGLFVDPQNPELLQHCAKAQASRIERMQFIVQKLHALGFTITEEDCLRESGGEAVGRPHIVAALGKYAENDAIIEHLRVQMEEAARKDPIIAEKYMRMMEIGPRQYPYDLFLSLDAFRPAYMDARYTPDIDEATKLIRHAGGMSFIAHYSYDRKKLPMDVVRTLLKDNRIDGVEVVYGARMRGTKDEGLFEQDKTMLRTLAGMYGRQLSGGADTHYPEDLEYYTRDKTYSGESKGLAEKLIASGQVSVRNSSFSAV